ncbi:MAG: alkaline phosphatase [Gemmatimonadota bacterium]
MAILTATLFAAGGTAWGAGGSSQAEESRDARRRAKNVILLIGDGTGASELTIARNYAFGAAGRMALDGLTDTGQMTTYSVREADPSKPDYASESASTATAWSTGSKTADGRISTAPLTDADLTNTIDVAEQAGLLTGNVTTAELTDATPAAPMAHVSARACQGPADMTTCPQDKKSAGGPGSIAEQSLDHGVDVLLGGGRARYEQVVDGGPFAGMTVIEQAEAQGYEVVFDRAGLEAAQPGTKLLGLFTAGNMSVEWTGLPAANPPSGPQRCTEDQRPANEPSLDLMTERALDLLTQSTASAGRGFFLQVESASIDKRNHTSQPCEQIGETVNFDRAVQVALDFAAADRHTLVIVTGDHAHTSQIVEPDQTPPPPGFSSILTTDEGENMMVTYGTGTTPTGQQHTGSQIPVAAFGPSSSSVRGLIDQTDLFGIMTGALGLG